MSEKHFLGLRDDYEAEQQQIELHKKYGIKKSVQVVEVQNPFIQALQVLVLAMGQMAGFVLRAGLVLLACIGLATLIFPELRDPFFGLLEMIRYELAGYFM